MFVRPLADDEYSTLKRVPEAQRRKALSQRNRIDPTGSLPWAAVEAEGFGSFDSESKGGTFQEHLRLCSSFEGKTQLPVSAVLGWQRHGCRLYDIGEILPALHRQIFGGSSYEVWASRRLTGIERAKNLLEDPTKASSISDALQTIRTIGLGGILSLRSRLEEETSFPEEGGLMISSHGDRALLPVPFDGMIKPPRQNKQPNEIAARLRNGVLDVDPDEPQFNVFGDEGGALPLYNVRALTVFWRQGSWEVCVEGVEEDGYVAVVYCLLWEDGEEGLSLSAHWTGRSAPNGSHEITLTVAHMAIWEMVVLVLLGLHRKAITYYEPRPQRRKSRKGQRGSRRSKPGAPKVCLLNTDLWARDVRLPDPDLTPPRERGESMGGSYTGPSYDVGVFKRRVWVDEPNVGETEDPIDIREGTRGQVQFQVWRTCNKKGYTVKGAAPRVTRIVPSSEGSLSLL
jgi:hypothetical protein